MKSKGIFRWMIGCIVVIMWIISSAEGADEGVEVEEKAEFFLGCMRLALWRGRHFEALAPSDRWQAEFCSDILRLHGIAYEIYGVLAPGYKEALLMRYKYNQTLVDFEICGMYIERCPQPMRDHYLRVVFDRLKNTPIMDLQHNFDDF